jgi:hypothetical protein
VRYGFRTCPLLIRMEQVAKRSVSGSATQGNQARTPIVVLNQVSDLAQDKTTRLVIAPVYEARETWHVEVSYRILSD